MAFVTLSTKECSCLGGCGKADYCYINSHTKKFGAVTCAQCGKTQSWRLKVKVQKSIYKPIHLYRHKPPPPSTTVVKKSKHLHPPHPSPGDSPSLTPPMILPAPLPPSPPSSAPQPLTPIPPSHTQALQWFRLPVSGGA